MREIKYTFSIKKDWYFNFSNWKDIHFDLFSIHWNHFGRKFTIFGIIFRWERLFPERKK